MIFMAVQCKKNIQACHLKILFLKKRTTILNYQAKFGVIQINDNQIDSSCKKQHEAI